MTVLINEDLKEDIGLNSLYQLRFKRIDEGLNKGNRQSSLLDTKGYATAELALKDPAIFSAWFLCVSQSITKKPVAKAITEGKKKDLLKSKQKADFYNFCFDKIEKENLGGFRQLAIDILKSIHYGTCYVEKIYDTVKIGKYKDFYYNPKFKSKKNGLWDFEYDDKANIIGFKSLIKPSKIWSKNKFISIPHFMEWDNPNGNGRFEQVWKYFDAKAEFFVFMLEKGARLVKDKQIFVKENIGTVGSSSNDHKDLLNKIKNHLVVFIPAGYDIVAENFDAQALQEFLAIFRELDSQIVKAYLGSSTIINESTTGTGNYNTAKNNENNMSFYQKIYDETLLQAIRGQIIPDLSLLNFDPFLFPEEIEPIIELEREKEEDTKAELEKDKTLIDMQILDVSTEEDLYYLREKYNLPENDSIFIEKEAELQNKKQLASDLNQNDANNVDASNNTDSSFYQ
jgi:hypothetical protein